MTDTPRPDTPPMIPKSIFPTPPTANHKAQENQEQLATATEGRPRDLAPGLRPRPQPDVPNIITAFGGLPPPPPPAAPPPSFKNKALKFPARKPKDSEDPGPETPKTPGKLAEPAGRGDVVKELEQRFAKQREQNGEEVKDFKEPERIPPRVSLTPQDKIAAEIPWGRANLKPAGSSQSVKRMREQLEQAEKEKEYNKANLFTRPNLTPRRFKITSKAQPPENVNQKPLKTAEPEISEPKPDPIPQAIPEPKPIVPRKKTERPPAIPEIVVQRLPTVSEVEVEVDEQPVTVAPKPIVPVQQLTQIVSRPDPQAPEDVDPYILWSVRALGVLLIILGLIKMEVYLWTLSWNMHIWNQLDL